MSASPKKAPGKSRSNAGRELATVLEFHALALVQRPFRSIFWLIERRKGRLQDRYENERSGS